MDKLPKGIAAQPPAVTPRQISMRFDNAKLQAMNAMQRAKAITLLASLLMQAAGKEYDNDKC